MVALAERLLGRGFELMIYDANVAVSRLLGANRAYVDSRIPHLSKLMAGSADAVVNHAEVCVVGAPDPAAIEALKRVEGRVIVDLVRFPGVRGVRGRTRTTSVSAGSPGPPGPRPRREPLGPVRPARLAGVPGAHRGGLPGRGDLPARHQARHRALRRDRGRPDPPLPAHGRDRRPGRLRQGVRRGALAHRPPGAPAGARRALRRRPRVQPAGPALPDRADAAARRHPLPLRPPRPRARALRVALRRAGRACCARSPWPWSARPSAPPTRSSARTRATGARRSSAAGCRPTGSAWCAARPT